MRLTNEERGQDNRQGKQQCAGDREQTQREKVGGRQPRPAQSGVPRHRHETCEQRGGHAKRCKQRDGQNERGIHLASLLNRSRSACTKASSSSSSAVSVRPT